MSEAATTATADCGHLIGQDFEWPGDDGTTLCYSCWEASEAPWWWAPHRAPALEKIAQLLRPYMSDADAEIVASAIRHLPTEPAP